MAALVDFDDRTVVLKKDSGRLIAMPIAKLSQADQEFLHSKAAADAAWQHARGNRLWVLPDGASLAGHVLDYGRRKVVIQRRLGEVMVDGKPYKKLPKLDQYLVRRIIEQFDGTTIKDLSGLEAWALKQRGDPRQFDCPGVLMEMEDREKAVIPFFVFSREDREFLEPGWAQWAAPEEDAKRKAEYDAQKQREATLLLRARARDYQRDLATRQIVELTAVESGLVDEWLVQLYPKPGVPGLPMQVFIPAHDSQMARVEAVTRYPGYFIGPIARASRRW
jgi:hypothetical protein